MKMHQTGEIAGGGSFMSHFFCLCCDVTNKEKGCPAAYRCSYCLRNDEDDEWGEITRSMVCYHQRYSIFINICTVLLYGYIYIYIYCLLCVYIYIIYYMFIYTLLNICAYIHFDYMLLYTLFCQTSSSG